ncbi:hypothetical protein SDC9_10791 [bioreactor metagenome]|uniref:Uncharacterized protein n=1 Tax=bioreactor metagenome TaxID=1076179 RepID=A0A644TDT5_9ZZZZ
MGIAVHKQLFAGLGNIAAVENIGAQAADEVRAIYVIMLVNAQYIGMAQAFQTGRIVQCADQISKIVIAEIPENIFRATLFPLIECCFALDIIISQFTETVKNMTASAMKSKLGQQVGQSLLIYFIPFSF